MFEVIAYYDDNCKNINLKKILELYLVEDLPDETLDNIQYSKRDGTLDEVLREFSPTPHILVRYVDTFSGEAADWEEPSSIQKILDRPYR